MRNLKKILVTSIILISVGFLGLATVLFTGPLDISNFGTGRGYNFNWEDMGHMGRLPATRNFQDLSFEDVRILTEQYLENNGFNNLEIAEIMEFSKNYYIEVIEKDTKIGAVELLVDKSTGVIFPEYGPNMMWNLKYGMHRRRAFKEDTIDMTINEEEAIEIGGKYLLKSPRDEKIGHEAEKFYGYYTIHTETPEGEIAGMLSVNGFTGEVWYHNWHGVFIDMSEGH